MTTWVGQLGARAPESPAILTADETWSTAELFARAAGAAAWLDELGIAPGTPVPAVVWAAPSAIALIVAGALTGRPVAPLGPQLTAAELAMCLDGMGASVVVTENTTATVAADAAATAGMTTASLPLSFPAAAPLPITAAPDDLAAILHTSGTSGRPKRVPMEQRRMARRTAVTGPLMQLGPGSRYFTAKGLHHIGGLGLTLVALGQGAAVIPVGRFSPEAWSSMAPFEPTHASTVPAMIETLLPLGILRFPSLRLIQYGGAPIHPDTLTRLLGEEPDLDVIGFFGQTEGSPIACLTPDDHRRAVDGRPDLLEAAGRACPGVELRINEPGSDGAGEVWARSAHFFGAAEDEWLHTGDIGRVDDEGYLRLSGRLGDMIIRGGENVHPLEVERVIGSHPDVAAVAVAAVTDRRLGETVGAWVVPVDPARPPSEDELRRHTRERLAGFKVPTVWAFCDALPMNANGKVVRRLLPR